MAPRCINEPIEPMTLGNMQANCAHPRRGDGDRADQIVRFAPIPPKLYFQRRWRAMVIGTGRVSPRETQTFGSFCDWRLTKR
jgi:hypothetical protein